MLGWAEMLSECPGVYPPDVNQPQMTQTSRIFESFNVTPSSTIVAFANFDKNVASDSKVSKAI
jgi:hypothetical protein